MLIFTDKHWETKAEAKTLIDILPMLSLEILYITIRDINIVIFITGHWWSVSLGCWSQFFTDVFS